MQSSESFEDIFEDIRERIETFLLGLRHPVLTEAGREVIDLSTSHYSLTTEHNKLLWHVWNDQTNLVRQITGIRRESPVRMELRFQKFGKGPPGVLVLAESRATPEQLGLRSRRALFCKQLRRILAQRYPDWKLGALTTEADLVHSFSGRYTRGWLSRGSRAWAVIGVGEQEDISTVEGILAYGIIWLDSLRRQDHKRVVEGLKLFVPANSPSSIAHRLSWLDSNLAHWEMYETGDEVRLLSTADTGNLKTHLPPLHALPPRQTHWEAWIEQVLACSPDVEARQDPQGLRLFSIRGLTVARETPKGLVFGVGQSETTLQDSTIADFRALLSNVLRYRHPQSEDRQHPYFLVQPERWMQSILAQQMDRLGYDLDSGVFYEQVPAVSGAERGLMDLLAINSDGRLVVAELKASEDIHLPLQALDYWMRVHWHHQRGEFERLRYFPGHVLSAQPPLLLLICPALQFHPACETILRYFSSTIEAVRVGLNENWREQLQVVFRCPR
ncbi:MAG: hypothetical protein A3H27_17600 [Acidobacteria bacterium RIFCSPLOWO2_02_FULL_59_13]|nr:MAG: hypothetical protein A3H27_17600 [Acidobacteria bacterium RIFCSPLOWO2_02_FULL_59_13]